MIELKAGVRVFGLRPEIGLAIAVAEGLWTAAGVPVLVLTSALDGLHTRQSYHYAGLAVDLRIHTVPSAARPAVVERLRRALGPDYVVIHEAIGQSTEHLHLHFAPAEAY